MCCTSCGILFLKSLLVGDRYKVYNEHVHVCKTQGKKLELGVGNPGHLTLSLNHCSGHSYLIWSQGTNLKQRIESYTSCGTSTTCNIELCTCSLRSPQLTATMLVGTAKQRFQGQGSVYESTHGNHNLIDNKCTKDQCTIIIQLLYSQVHRQSWLYTVWLLSTQDMKGIKDLCCSSTVWLLSTQIWMG